MASGSETTPLLSSVSDPVNPNGHNSASGNAQHEDESGKILTVGGLGAEVEAGAAAPEPSQDIDSPSMSTSSLVQVIAVLMIGLFISGLDSSLIMATHPRIASEFDALEDSSWLFISFLLAGSATQILYAKLSDIYGRKILLIFCYVLFAVGCTIIGVSRKMWHVILGRVISGSGGSGMSSLGLVLTTDLIPLRQVATWLGYTNVVVTTGRSLGGPVGGWLADRIGWRWSFLGQVPFFLMAITGAIFVIPNTKTASQGPSADRNDRLSRIDFFGSLLLGTSVLVMMLPLELGGVRLPWTHPAIPSLFVAGALIFCLFLANEAWWAKEPAIPIRLLKSREILAPYFIIACIAGAQTALMYSVPLYFQVTAKASNTAAGLHLVPAVIGNALGGIASGRLIKRTGRYKIVITAASISASIGYIFLIIRWHGHTNWWESLYIFPGGFGSGLAMSAVFVALNAVVEPAHKAVVSSGLYLAIPVGMALGVATSSAVMLEVLQNTLRARLEELGLVSEEIAEIISQAAANVGFIRQLRGDVEQSVIRSYVTALRYSYVAVLAFSASGLLWGLLLRNRRL
ncbi:MFS general substrate transporter [Xylariaceae sp. FL0016]|nr:MFS general substrate transporter [Xylariaceae sp. FL0016]